MSIVKMSGVSTPEAARLLTFDSEHFGIRVGQTNHSDVDEWAAANAVGVLFLLADSSNVEGINDACRRGFLVTDIRVELECKVRAFPTYGLRTAVMADLSGMVRIARESHRITRFYADPNFDRARCDDLYEAWIRNSFAGWAQQVFVYGTAGRPLGYVTIHLESELASIGLIAVDASARGQGIGHLLCRGALGWAERHGARVMRTVTQARNREAVRLFEACGFRMTKTGVWLHKWR